MRGLVILLFCGCIGELPGECFDAATDSQCVEVEGPLAVPPTTASEFDLVRSLCSAACIRTPREVRLARRDKEPVPLLMKLQFPFVLAVTDRDRGVDLDVGPTPGLAGLVVAGQSNLESFSGLDAPSLSMISASALPALHTLEGLRPTMTPLSLSLEDVPLQDLTGLGSFRSLGGLGVERCPSLTSLTGIESIVSIESLAILETSVSSLAPLKPELRVVDLTIRGNRALPNCDAAVVASRIASGPVQVSDNKPCP